ncbi:MAG TPA: glycosyltransferase family 4 protein [Thermoanaerobaculia bacterium]|nr:glycosyltransferase family 4 protein [Thermoanaerobaculia bacterium]
MRIVHVIGYFQPQFGFEETYTTVHQAAAGHEVHVVTTEWFAKIPGLEKRARHAGVRTETHRGVTIHRLPGIDLPRDLIFVRGGLAKVAALEPDVVHAHGIQQPLNLLLPRLKRQRSFVLVYDYHFDLSFDRRIRRYHGWNPLLHLAAMEYRLIRRRAARRALERADAILPTAPASAAQLTSFFDIPQERLQLMQLGVDIERFDRDPAGGRQMRRELGIPAEAFVLLFPGTYSVRKRVELLLPIVQQMGSEAFLLLVGDGEPSYMDAVLAEAARSGIGDRVIRTGIQPPQELKRYFSAADLALFLSSASVTTLEVMACGVPVVLGNQVDFQREAVQRGGGWLVDGSRPDLWPAEIARMAADRAEIARRGVAARAYVRSERSYSAYAGKLIEIYRACGAR